MTASVIQFLRMLIARLIASVKYVDATLDQALSFIEMAQSLLKKANARLKFFVQE